MAAVVVGLALIVGAVYSIAISIHWLLGLAVNVGVLFFALAFGSSVIAAPNSDRAGERGSDRGAQ